MSKSPTDMTLDDARAALSTAVYAAAQILERLEYAGKLCGNGHHARQEVATAALKVLNERWIETEEAKP